MSGDLSSATSDQYLQLVEMQHEQKVAVLSLIGDQPRQHWELYVRSLGLDDAPIKIRARNGHTTRNWWV